MLGLTVLTASRYLVMAAMAEESERLGFVGVFFALVPVEPGIALGVVYVEGRLLPKSKVLASKEEEVTVVFVSN